MLKQFRIVVLVMTLITSSLTLPTMAWAQGENQASTAEMGGTRKQIATIIFAGLAGAILGLSTLSFYGRPQDKLSNIAIGFAVGVIGGTVYTTYQAIHAPYDQYQVLRTNFSDQLSDRLAQEDARYLNRPLGWQWTF